MERALGRQTQTVQEISFGITFHESETVRQLGSNYQPVRTREVFILLEVRLSLAGTLSDEFTAELLSAGSIYCFELLAMVEGLIS